MLICYYQRGLYGLAIFLAALGNTPQCLAFQIQQNGSQNGDNTSPYRLQVRSQMVVMDVVVRDPGNNPVRGLKASDFTVTDNGVPQKLISFDAIDTTKPNEPLPKIDSTSQLDRLAPHSPVNIIVLDEITTLFQDEYFARYSLDKYLKSQGDTLSEPTILMARTIDRLIVLCDYTTSKQVVMQALNKHLVGSDWKNQDPNRHDEQVGAAFASLIEIAKATQGHLGHKNLIWVGRGFPSIQWEDLPEENMTTLRDAVIECANILRDSRITLYAIDPAGVVAPTETQDANGDIVDEQDPFGGGVDFGRMAQATGGLAIYGKNDVDKLIGQAITSGEVFYTIAFRPTKPIEGEDAKFRSIKISMSNPALVAATREGYYPDTHQATAPVAGALSHSSEFGLSSAISAMLVFDGVPLQITRLEANKGFGLAFPTSSLGLQDDGNVMSGDLDLLVFTFDRNSKVLSKSGKVITLHVKDADASSPDHMIHLTTTVSDLDQAARVRFVVRSHANGRIGADNVFLVPQSQLHDPSVNSKHTK